MDFRPWVGRLVPAKPRSRTPPRLSTIQVRLLPGGVTEERLVCNRGAGRCLAQPIALGEGERIIGEQRPLIAFEGAKRAAAHPYGHTREELFAFFDGFD